MSKALSGCAVRAVIQQETAESDTHYLTMTKHRLTMLYELVDAPNVREQLSDEIDWVNEKLGVDG